MHAMTNAKEAVTLPKYPFQAKQIAVLHEGCLNDEASVKESLTTYAVRSYTIAGALFLSREPNITKTLVETANAKQIHLSIDCREAQELFSACVDRINQIDEHNAYAHVISLKEYYHAGDEPIHDLTNHKFGDVQLCAPCELTSEELQHLLSAITIGDYNAVTQFDISQFTQLLKDTLLLASCQYGHLDTVHYLVSVGANANIVNTNTLAVLLARGHQHVVEYLCQSTHVMATFNLESSPQSFTDYSLKHYLPYTTCMSLSQVTIPQFISIPESINDTILKRWLGNQIATEIGVSLSYKDLLRKWWQSPCTSAYRDGVTLVHRLYNYAYSQKASRDIELWLKADPKYVTHILQQILDNCHFCHTFLEIQQLFNRILIEVGLGSAKVITQKARALIQDFKSHPLAVQCIQINYWFYKTTRVRYSTFENLNRDSRKASMSNKRVIEIITQDIAMPENIFASLPEGGNHTATFTTPFSSLTE